MIRLLSPLVFAAFLSSCVGQQFDRMTPEQSGEFVLVLESSEDGVIMLHPQGRADDCFTAIVEPSVREALLSKLGDFEPQSFTIGFVDLDKVKWTGASYLDFGDGPFLSSSPSAIYEGQQYFTQCLNNRLVQIRRFERVSDIGGK